MIQCSIRRSAGVIAIALAWLCLSPAAAWACSCIQGGPPCQAVFKTEAVFRATVERIDDETRSMSIGGNERSIAISGKRVHVIVSDVFRGTVAKAVDIHTGSGGGDCGYGFNVGSEYLIYADTNNQGLSTGICSRTRSIADAAEDLAFLRTMSAKPSATGKLQGTAIYFDDARAAEGIVSRRPFAGAKVTLTSSATTVAVQSDADGRFAADLAAGEYRVSVSVPAGYYATSDSRVTLADTRGCAAVEAFIRDDGHIDGRVVDTEGKGVPNLAISLGSPQTGREPVQWRYDGVRSNDDGRFSFKQLPAGTYVVAANGGSTLSSKADVGPAVFAPGVLALSRAQRIDLGPRETIEAEPLTMPDTLRLVQITGVVLDVSGRPASGARVYLKPGDNTFRLLGPAVITDAEGRFAIAGFSGISYTFTAEYQHAGSGFDSGEQKNILASEDMKPITLQLIKR